MQTIEAYNVRDALPQAVDYLLQYGVREQTRLGEVLASPTPVAIRYVYPKQHVLLNKIRDANPFFHLMEAMWMLAGRRDGAFLDYYVKDFSKRFGTNGIINDAYGYRWRHGLMFDQLNEIVAQLRKDTTTRQCVLQMWGAGEHPDLTSSLPKPCNLVATFRVIGGRFLEMSVFNRSNDLIWGCCGANAVHFPILQEYLASRVGLQVGSYWQISTNLHLYQDHINMMKKRLSNGDTEENQLVNSLIDNTHYEETQPLITEPRIFDQDLYETMAWIEDIHKNKEVYDGTLSNKFLRDVVLPMAKAHQCYKNKNIKESYTQIEKVAAEDWRTAGKQWLYRRQ